MNSCIKVSTLSKWRICHIKTYSAVICIMRHKQNIISLTPHVVTSKRFCIRDNNGLKSELHHI